MNQSLIPSRSLVTSSFFLEFNFVPTLTMKFDSTSATKPFTDSSQYPNSKRFSDFLCIRGSTHHTMPWSRSSWGHFPLHYIFIRRQLFDSLIFLILNPPTSPNITPPLLCSHAIEIFSLACKICHNYGWTSSKNVHLHICTLDIIIIKFIHYILLLCSYLYVTIFI